jgi:hypothetical protein
MVLKVDPSKISGNIFTLNIFIKNPLPCMNSELRGAIYRKHMFYSQYTKNRNTKTWEKFRKQRNLVTKLKKNSMKTYFLEHFTGGAKNVNFWKTVKPFFSKKCNSIIFSILSDVICWNSKFFLHIHMIFNFQCTRVSSGVIYSVFPNFICNCREESIKLFRNFTCIIYNFIVFTQNYILIPRVTFISSTRSSCVE